MSQLSQRVEIDTSYSDVYSSVSAVYYRDEDYIASGAVGAVYRAALSDAPADTHPRFVIKVKDKKSLVSDDDFNLEYRVLEGIYKHGSDVAKRSIPSTAQGTVVETGAPALVLPFFASDEQLTAKLSTLYDAGNVEDAETLGLRAAVTYAHIMQGLRASGYTVTDRKNKDFYLRDDTIIVLDWNVVGEWTTDYFATEVMQLATLWYSFYMNQIAPTEMTSYADAVWQRSGSPNIEGGAVSVGTRWLLSSVFNTPFNQLFVTSNGEPGYDGVLTLLNAWMVLRDAPYPHESNLDAMQPDARLRDAFVEVLPQGAYREGQVDGLLLDLTIADLFWRKAPADDKAYWWQAREDFMQQVIERDTVTELYAEDATDDELLSLLEDSDVNGARDLALKQREEATGLQKANKNRWYHIFDALSDLLRAPSRTQQQVRNHAREAGILLAKHPTKDTAENLQRVETACDTVQALVRDKFPTVAETFSTLAVESQFREFALKYRKSNSIQNRLKFLEHIEASVTPDSAIVQVALPGREFLQHCLTLLVAEDTNAVIGAAEEINAVQQSQPILTNSNDAKPFSDLVDLIIELKSSVVEKRYAQDTLPKIVPVLNDNILLNNAAGVKRILKQVAYDSILTGYDEMEATIRRPNRDKVTWGMAEARVLQQHKDIIQRADGILSAATDDAMSTRKSKLANDARKNPGSAWARIENITHQIEERQSFYEQWDYIDRWNDMYVKETLTIEDAEELRNKLKEASRLNMDMKDLTGNDTQYTLEDFLNKFDTFIAEQKQTRQSFEDFEARYQEKVREIEEAKEQARAAEEQLAQAQSLYDEAVEFIKKQLEREINNVRQEMNEAIEGISKSQKPSLKPLRSSSQLQNTEKKIEELRTEFQNKLKDLEHAQFHAFVMMLKGFYWDKNTPTKYLTDVLNDAEKELRTATSIAEDDFQECQAKMEEIKLDVNERMRNRINKNKDDADRKKWESAIDSWNRRIDESYESARGKVSKR